MNIIEKINRRAKVANVMQIVQNKSTYGRKMYALDLSTWSFYPPFTDSEYQTIYRSSLLELSLDTFDL